MTRQVKNLKHLQSEIDSALSLITQKGKSLDNVAVPQKGLIAGTESLLQRCQNVVNSKKNEKPVLRVVHHLACSGGSLVSKCISVMPNTFLLSEVHPHSTLHLQFSDKARYLPTDYTTLCRYAGIPNINELSEDLFLTSVERIEQHVRNQGGELVLRDHSHVDFCTEQSPAKKSTLREILSEKFTLLSVVNIRNPIDAYLSLKKNDWVHFSPARFDEYCRRLLCFTAQFKREDIVRYEDFVDSPDRTLKRICGNLSLSFSTDYLDLFNTARVTGDSGRRGDDIVPRERRECDSAFKKEVNNSKHFRIISKKYGYTL